MASILTYNQIIELLTDIARRHFQINTFYLGKNWELENSDDILFPYFRFIQILVHLKLMLIMNIRLKKLDSFVRL